MRYPGLTKLRKRLSVTCSVDSPAPDGTGERVLGNVRGEVLLCPTGRTIMAEGRLVAEVEMSCARCLKLHAVPLDMEVARECSLSQIDDPESYREPEEDLPPIPIVDGDEIDLSELVRQLVIVNTPPRSLCRPDCKGLCPGCGADLNVASCTCHTDDVDPRLAPLKALLGKG